MKILDLFAGKGGEQRREKIESMGHEYITVDIEPKFNCTHTANILELFASPLGGGYDFIWASPPCTAFSVASMGHHWDERGIPDTKGAIDGIRIVLKTIDIIKELEPKAWIIENPRGMLRKLQPMKKFRRWTVTYCQYGDDRMKPTDLWGVVPGWTPRQMCKNGDSCHVAAPRGSRTGTQGMKNAADRAVVPVELWIEILECLETQWLTEIKS